MEKISFSRRGYFVLIALILSGICFLHPGNSFAAPGTEPEQTISGTIKDASTSQPLSSE